MLAISLANHLLVSVSAHVFVSGSISGCISVPVSVSAPVFESVSLLVMFVMLVVVTGQLDLFSATPTVLFVANRALIDAASTVSIPFSR